MCKRDVFTLSFCDALPEAKVKTGLVRREDGRLARTMVAGFPHRVTQRESIAQ